MTASMLQTLWVRADEVIRRQSDDNFVVSAGIFLNRCRDISSAHAGRWQEGHYGTILPPKTATLGCE